MITFKLTLIRTLAFGASLFFATHAFPCQRDAPISTTDMVRDADAIVRAVAADYARPPAATKMAIAGVPDSRIRFKILEIVRGTDFGSDLILPGYLVPHDDFNDHAAPYQFVRPNGRTGSCFANQYRSGAQFLLLLKKQLTGEYTVNWYALGPVNEQLRSDQDPWLLWVREQSKRTQ